MGHSRYMESGGPHLFYPRGVSRAPWEGHRLSAGAGAPRQIPGQAGFRVILAAKQETTNAPESYSSLKAQGSNMGGLQYSSILRNMQRINFLFAHPKKGSWRNWSWASAASASKPQAKKGCLSVQHDLGLVCVCVCVSFHCMGYVGW